jgi:hypothetical protein
MRQSVRVERPPSEWERRVLEALAGIDAPGADAVRESLPHLVVTGGCDCGCASFNVRDTRYPPVPHHLCRFSNGSTFGESVGFVLWLGVDGRPLSVDVDNERGMLPDPALIRASAS